VALVRATLGEARDCPELRGWPFLDDVATLVEGLNTRILSASPGF